MTLQQSKVSTGASFDQKHDITGGHANLYLSFCVMQWQHSSINKRNYRGNEGLSFLLVTSATFISVKNFIHLRSICTWTLFSRCWVWKTLKIQKINCCNIVTGLHFAFFCSPFFVFPVFRCVHDTPEKKQKKATHWQLESQPLISFVFTCVYEPAYMHLSGVENVEAI